MQQGKIRRAALRQANRGMNLAECPGSQRARLLSFGTSSAWGDRRATPAPSPRGADHNLMSACFVYRSLSLPDSMVLLSLPVTLCHVAYDHQKAGPFRVGKPLQRLQDALVDSGGCQERRYCHTNICAGATLRLVVGQCGWRLVLLRRAAVVARSERRFTPLKGAGRLQGGEIDGLSWGVGRVLPLGDGAPGFGRLGDAGGGGLCCRGDGRLKAPHTHIPIPHIPMGYGYMESVV